MIRTFADWLKRSYAAMLALLLIAVPVFLVAGRVQADFLAVRSVTIGSSIPSATTTHDFRFSIATAGMLGSIEMEYCSNDPFIGTACTAPAGLDASGASLTAQTGETGFVLDPLSTANRIILSRVAVPAAAQPVSYNFSGVVNPSTTSQSVYVRLSTFASTDATGPRTDTGAVVFSTSSGLGTLAYVPPHLTFCVGVTVSPDCSSASGSGISLGELSSAAPRVATSQFAGATNDAAGYSASILGTTMTSGNNIIPVSGSPTVSQPGSGQFGINLRANNNPAIGRNPIGSGTAVVRPNYNVPDRFMFQPASTLVSSPLTTNFNTFTVSYLVNINGSQPPGVYSTTATFLATAAF